MDCRNVVYYVVPSVPGRDSNKPNNVEEVAWRVFCTLGLIPYRRIGRENRTRGRTGRLHSVARNVEGDVTVGGGAYGRERRCRQRTMIGVAVVVRDPSAIGYEAPRLVVGR